MGHSIIIVHSSFFFRPDLDLCGLPAWLLPWQHLEPNSSCWPYVFTEARACSSLLRGFASPSKVSSYRLTKTLLTGGISIIVSFTLFWFLPLSHSVSQSLTNSRTHTPTHTSTAPVMFPLYTYVKNVFPAACQTVQCRKQKVDITCSLLLVVPFKNFSPHPKIHTHFSLTCRFFFWFLMSDMMTQGRKHLKFDQ